MDLALVIPKTDPKLNSFEIFKKTDEYVIFKSGYGSTVKKGV